MSGKKTKTLSGLFPSAKKRDHVVKTSIGGEITVQHMKGAIQSRVAVRERKEETGQLEDVADRMGHKNIIAGTPARRRTSTSRAHMTSSYFNKNNVEEEHARVPKRRRLKKSDLKITNQPIVGLKRKHPVVKGNNVLRQFDGTDILAKKYRYNYDSNIERMYGRKEKPSTSTAKTSSYFNNNTLEEPTSTSCTRTPEPRISRPLTSHVLKKRNKETNKELKDGPSSKLPKMAIQGVLNQFLHWNNPSTIVASAKKISRRALTQEERDKLSGSDSDYSTISTEFSRACNVSPFPPPQRNKQDKKTEKPKVMLKFPLNILRQKVENTVNHRMRIPDYSQMLKANARALFRQGPMSREMLEILTNEINDVEHTKMPSQDLSHRKTLAHHSNHSSTLSASQSYGTSPYFTEETEIRPMVAFSSQPNTLTQAETRPSPVMRSSSQCSNGNQIHPHTEFQSHHDYNLRYNSCLNIPQACTNVPLYRPYPLVRELPNILVSPDSDYTDYFRSSQNISYEHEDVVNINQNQCPKAVVRNLFASPQNHPPLDTNINQQCCSQIHNQNHNDNNVHRSHSHPVRSDGGGAISAHMFKVPSPMWSGNFSASAQLQQVFPGTSHTFYNSQEKHGSNKMDRMGNLDFLNGETMIAEAVRTELTDSNEEMITNKWQESCFESCSKYFGTSAGEAEETVDWNAPVREKVAEMPVVNHDASEINLWRKKVNTSRVSGQFSGDDLSRTVVIGNVDCKFIAAKMPFRGAHDGSKEMEVLVLFDQHAVHERILLERHIERAFEEHVPGEKSIVYSLATPPMRMNFTDTEVRIMESNKKNYRLLGIQLEIVDSHTVMFLTIPKCFAERAGREHGPNREKTGRRLMRSIVEDQARYIMNTSGAIQAMPIAILDVLKSQACRGAVKFGDSLSTEACVQLINELKNCKVPFQCAHGRPAVAPIFLDLKVVE